MSAVRDFGVAEVATWTPRSAFHQVVEPALTAAGLLPRGKIVDAEGTSQDMRAGIDYIISAVDGTQTTLASRVQWNVDYGTLSIRYRTARGTMSELTKRYQSVLAGGSYPTLTLQAYVSKPGGVILNAYVLRTDDLYRHVIKPSPDGNPEHFLLCGCAGRPRPAPGGAQFIPVAISDAGKARIGSKSTLIACGVEVQSFRPIDVTGGLW